MMVNIAENWGFVKGDGATLNPELSSALPYQGLLSMIYEVLKNFRKGVWGLCHAKQSLDVD